MSTYSARYRLHAKMKHDFGEILAQWTERPTPVDDPFAEVDQLFQMLNEAGLLVSAIVYDEVQHIKHPNVQEPPAQ